MKDWIAEKTINLFGRIIFWESKTPYQERKLQEKKCIQNLLELVNKNKSECSQDLRFKIENCHPAIERKKVENELDLWSRRAEMLEDWLYHLNG